MNLLKASAALLFMLTLSRTAPVVLFYDFENGQVPNANSSYPNTTPPAILTESNGNHFLRMTAVPQDCGPTFATTCPRTREELLMGHAPETSNITTTYSFSLRIPSSNPSGQYNVLAQLFQGIGVPRVSGKTIWLGSQNGRIFVRNDLNQQTLDVGPIQYDKWVDYSLAVYMSTDASLGLVDVSVDGQHVGRLTGYATLKDSQYVTDLFLNVIDYLGVFGVVDFDNVQIKHGRNSTDSYLKRPAIINNQGRERKAHPQRQPLKSATAVRNVIE